MIWDAKIFWLILQNFKLVLIGTENTFWIFINRYPLKESNQCYQTFTQNQDQALSHELLESANGIFSRHCQKFIFNSKFNWENFCYSKTLWIGPEDRMNGIILENSELYNLMSNSQTVSSFKVIGIHYSPWIQSEKKTQKKLKSVLNWLLKLYTK